MTFELLRFLQAIYADNVSVNESTFHQQISLIEDTTLEFYINALFHTHKNEVSLCMFLLKFPCS